MDRSNVDISQEEFEELKEKSAADADSIIGSIKNPILLILQTHLYTESLLERFIVARLPKGKRIIDKGRLSYYQKVLLADSIGLLMMA